LAPALPYADRPEPERLDDLHRLARREVDAQAFRPVGRAVPLRSAARVAARFVRSDGDEA